MLSALGKNSLGMSLKLVQLDFPPFFFTFFASPRHFINLNISFSLPPWDSAEYTVGMGVAMGVAKTQLYFYFLGTTLHCIEQLNWF